MSKKALCITALSLTSMLPLAAADAQAPAADQGMTQTLVMVAIAIAFFYFILWRPEQKRRKALEQQQGAMKKGDQVVCMGIVGTISRIKEQTVVIRSAGTEIEFLKAAITDVKPGSAAPEETTAS